jgi:Transposase DDE domain
MIAPLEWAQEEFSGAIVADLRWRHRLIRTAAWAAAYPAGAVTDAVLNAAARQGAYGLLESSRVTAAQVAAASSVAMARRSAVHPLVYVPVDGSSLNLAEHTAGSKGFGAVGTYERGARGLKVITALGIAPDGTTLGVGAQVYWARQRSADRSPMRTVAEKETQRWLDTLKEVRDHLAADAPHTQAWFLLDREGDAWPILEELALSGHRFTVRASHDRRASLGRRDGYLRPLLREQKCRLRYRIAVERNGKRRLALLEVRAATVLIDFRIKRTEERFVRRVNAVMAVEVSTPPAGEERLDWVLLTNHSVEDKADLQKVINGYALRWRIEDFHRTWKSGACNVEDTQLRSLEAVLKWARILAAVSARIERIKHLSRTSPNQAATTEFTRTELDALVLLRFTIDGRPAPSTTDVTLETATQWLAECGGYTGRSSGGPPGSVTISRGLRRVIDAAALLEALTQKGKK